MTIRYDAFPDHDTVQIDIGGTITEAEVEEVWSWLDRFMEGRDKVHVVEVISDLTGTEPAALWTGARLDLKHLSRFGRIAVVSDTDWTARLARAADAVTGLEVRHFDMDALSEARDWASTGSG